MKISLTFVALTALSLNAVITQAESDGELARKIQTFESGLNGWPDREGDVELFSIEERNGHFALWPMN